MKARNFTPGPWTQKFGAFTPGYASTMRLFSPDNTHAVCDVFWGGPSSSANARLIAAAPELLEALKRVLMATPFSDRASNPLFNEIADLINRIEGFERE